MSEICYFFVTYLTDYCTILHNIFQLKSDFEEKMCIFAKSNSCVPWKNTIRRRALTEGDNNNSTKNKSKAKHRLRAFSLLKFSVINGTSI